MARKTYNDEFQTPAAKLGTEQGYTIKQAAQNLGVDQGSIRHWVRKFAPISSSLAPNATAEQLQRENQRLREENRGLLMEREILKKAATTDRLLASLKRLDQIVSIRIRPHRPGEPYQDVGFRM